jgi:electron transfer flavoprotein beta subunit
MKIFVCLKQVPDTETKIKLLPDAKGIDFTGVKWIINPYDEYAVEEAVKYKESHAGAQVFVISIGPKKRTADSVRSALAMGADEGILVDGPDYLDPNTTAHLIAEVIKKEGPAHLIFTGKMAIDDNASSVGQMAAEYLDIPHTSVVSKATYSNDVVSVEREVEGGAKEIVELKGSALIAATKGLNMPRYASLPNIMKAKKKVLKEYEMATLGFGEDSQKTQLVSFALPPEKPAVKMLSGDSKSVTSQLVTLLRDESKVL